MLKAINMSTPSETLNITVVQKDLAWEDKASEPGGL